MTRWVNAGAAILAWLAGTPAWAGPSIPLAEDLARLGREAQSRRVAILLLYTQRECSWCERARREYLLPLHRDPASAGRVIVREIDIGSDAALADFAGQATRHADFARRESVRVVPTVIVYTPAGERAAEAIVGLRIPDFYGAYVERAVDEGIARLR